MNDLTRLPAAGPAAMPDTQSAADGRRLAIQRVGVKQLRYPLSVSVAGTVAPTVATWSLDVALPADRKGTHMSRFVEWLERLAAGTAPLDAALLRSELPALLERLHADEGRIEARFPFFIRKLAPVSGVASLLDHEGAWIAERRDGVSRLWCEVAVPVKSLCPCSKEISDYGAHNQRSVVTIRAELLDEPGHAVGFETLVRVAEAAASSEIWGLLKRSDEKWITERAYDNPKFVEDLVRDVALGLNATPGIGRYHIEVENFESIHNHSAFAVIDRE